MTRQLTWASRRPSYLRSAARAPHGHCTSGGGWGRAGWWCWSSCSPSGGAAAGLPTRAWLPLRPHPAGSVLRLDSLRGRLWRHPGPQFMTVGSFAFAQRPLYAPPPPDKSCLLLPSVALHLRTLFNDQCVRVSCNRVVCVSLYSMCWNVCPLLNGEVMLSCIKGVASSLLGTN